jgi:hypothetical protein
MMVSGVTHLLVGDSSTPNSVPSFLTATIPHISTSLLALDISANYLASLSPALAACVCLEELNISANPLRALPEFLAQLTSLRVLLADSTGISTIPAPLSALDKLHTVSIRCNKMHTLLSWLCTMPCLESLLVDGNPFQGPWKALVEPLLAKMPMTPAYPPSTPMIPQLSATYSSTSNTTTPDNTDNSDTEELTDQDEPSASNSNLALNGPSSHSTSLLAPSPLPSTSTITTSDSNPEDDTITPAHARLLGRSVTAPSGNPTFSPPHPHSRPLSRNRTTPNRSYFERQRGSRAENANDDFVATPLSPPPVAATIPERVESLNDPAVTDTLNANLDGRTSDAGNDGRGPIHSLVPKHLESRRDTSCHVLC